MPKMPIMEVTGLFAVKLTPFCGRLFIRSDVTSILRPGNLSKQRWPCISSNVLIALLLLFSFPFTANGTTVAHEYVQIDACGCEACQYNPFSPMVGVSKPEEIITNLN